MRLLILIVSLLALVNAKPEMYRENEDFQYSRSSSDEGSKQGYYGAQRGNMGGNYEKSHNMDSLAQHHMSTLVRQVDGELGDGANTRTGSVYTDGNSRGIFGSGHYDLSNLKGRNFGEGVSYGDSQLLSQNSAYRNNLYSSANDARSSASQLRTSGYQSTGSASQRASQFDNQQIDGHYSESDNYEYGAQGASNYKYYSHGGNQARSQYENNANLYDQRNYDINGKNRLVSTVPVRVYIRPGTRVTIPTAVETYDTAQSSLVQNQNIANSETELLSNSGQQINVVKPQNKPKHYESSYSYHKEWEKHDTQPATAISTENPFPKNSELYDEAQTSELANDNLQSELAVTNDQTSSNNNAYTSNINTGYASGYRASAAAANRLQYQSQRQGAVNSATSNGYTLGKHSSEASDTNNLIDSAFSQPKSYQSSYSYHKSWERQGDPYVIKPIGVNTNGQTSERLLSASENKNSFSSSHYGNHYSQVGHNHDNCD